MLLLDEDTLERLELVTASLIRDGFRFAAVFAQYDGRPSRHGESGDPSWFAMSRDEADWPRFMQVHLQDPVHKIGLLLLQPAHGDPYRFAERAAAGLERIVPILYRAMEEQRADERARERKRRRRGDWGSRELPRARGSARATRSRR